MIFVQPGHITFIVEVTNVAKHCIVLHTLEMTVKNDLAVACGSHDNVCLFYGIGPSFSLHNPP